MRIITRKSATTETGIADWTIGYVDAAEKDGHRFLNAEQYEHAVGLIEQLALESNPRISQVIDVRPVQDYFEVRDKGGVLGKINLRIYFAVYDERKLILVLAADKKEQEGPTAKHMITRIKNRKREADRELLKKEGR